MNAWSQVSAVYGGGPFYSGGQAVLDDLRASGFNTVILWTIHVGSAGNMNFNDIPVIDGFGNYIGDPDWANRIASLRRAPTAIDRIEIGVASAGATDFENIESLINAHGTGSDTVLYKAFQNLKTVTGADAVNFDDESNYDVSTMVQFAVMLADLGYKVTFVPYTRQSFWETVYRQVEAQRPGTIDRVYLQVYAGGAGNNPVSWNGSFGDLKVIPVRVGQRQTTLPRSTMRWRRRRGLRQTSLRTPPSASPRSTSTPIGPRKSSRTALWGKMAAANGRQQASKRLMLNSNGMGPW